MDKSIEQFGGREGEFSAPGKKEEDLSIVEKDIAETLMNSPHYGSLTPEEKIRLIEYLKRMLHETNEHPKKDDYI